MNEGNAAVVRFFGYIVIAIGVLMALTAGACTAFLFIMSLQGTESDQSLTWTSLSLGLPVVGLGVGLIALGRFMVRRAAPKPPADEVF